MGEMKRIADEGIIVEEALTQREQEEVLSYFTNDDDTDGDEFPEHDPDSCEIKCLVMTDEAASIFESANISVRCEHGILRPFHCWRCNK